MTQVTELVDKDIRTYVQETRENTEHLSREWKVYIYIYI